MNLPYFKFFATEWISGEVFLESYELKGAFIDACALYWKHQGNITRSKLQKWFKNTPSLVDDLINAGLIKVDGDNLIIEFMDEQLEILTFENSRNSRNGIIGNLIKKGVFNSTKEAEGMSDPELKDLLKSNINNAPRTPPYRIKNKNKNKNKNIIDESFEIFWNAYDKKKGKEKVFDKWQLLSNEDQQAIMKYIPLYKKEQPDPKYRKNPITFLNNRTWKDEIILKPESKPREIPKHHKMKF